MEWLLLLLLFSAGKARTRLKKEQWYRSTFRVTPPVATAERDRFLSVFQVLGPDFKVKSFDGASLVAEAPMARDMDVQAGQEVARPLGRWRVTFERATSLEPHF